MPSKGNPSKQFVNRKVTEQRLTKFLQTFLDERDIFFIVYLKYATGTLPLPQKEVIKRLQRMALYKDCSEKQLRRLLEKALNDPRSDHFLEVKLTPPIDWELGKVIQNLLPGMREVIVIPSVEDFDPKASHRFLGLAAATVFGHRFIGGQAIGLGTGSAVKALVSFLPLEEGVVNHLKFFALIHRNAYDGETGAEALMEILARCASLPNPLEVDGTVAPERLKAKDLDWAFIEFEPLKNEELKGKGFVAEILGHLLRKDGMLMPSEEVQVFSPLFLQQMAQQGKGVVAISSGTGGAKAIFAELQIRRHGKPMFNFLITDDACANELLNFLGYRISDVPRRKDWWVKRHIFLAAFLKYSSTSRQTVVDIAKSLSLSAKQVKRFLEYAAQGWANVEPVLSFRVNAPSSERALEASLLKNCGLMEVRVTPTFEDKEQNLKLVGQAGATFLSSLLRGRTEFTVGFGGGRAVRAVVESLNFKRLFHNLPFLKQLRICILDRNPLPKLLGVTAETILTPSLTSTEDKDRFVGCHCENLEDTSKLDAVFLSIGSLNPPDNILVFLQEDKKLLAEQDRLVGAMLFQFITYDGQVIPTRWAKELRVMPLSNLQKMVSENKPVVIVARGAHKADAIFTAYQMRLFNCLVVDRSLAEAILTRLCSTSLTVKNLASENMLNLPP